MACALAWRAWPAGAASRPLLGLVLEVGRGLVQGWGVRVVIEEAQVANRVGLFPLLILLATVMLPIALSPLRSYVQLALSYRTTQETTRTLMRATLGPPGIDHLENPKYHDVMQVVRTQAHVPGALFDWLATAMATVITLGASVAVLVSIEVALVVPLLVTALVGLLQVSSRRRALVASERSIPAQRLTRRIVELATTSASHQEIRMLQAEDWLTAKHGQLVRETESRLLSAEARPTAAAAVAGFMQGGMLVLGIWLLMNSRDASVAAGDIAFGLVVLYTCLQLAASLGTMGSDVARNNYYARQLCWLLDYAAEGRRSQHGKVPVPRRMKEGIVLKHASFAYPGHSDFALHDLNLELRAGSVVALVGGNGAGKTTLGKLLLQFYEPTSGSIEVDGVDVRNFGAREWRKRCAGMLQDFVECRFVAQDSIVGGQVPADREVYERAAVQAGAAEFLELLPSAYLTQLGREFDGVELSKGQWQRVSLARALVRSDPLLVVFDEPSAYIDPVGKAEVIDRSLRRSVLGTVGGVAIVVTHSPSIARAADVIVVLQDGKIAETGTHEALMEGSGWYAAYAAEHA